MPVSVSRRNYNGTTQRPAVPGGRFMNIIKSLIAISALIVMAASPAACFASPAKPGAYMSFFLGGSVPQDANATITEFNPVTTKDALVQIDPGFNIGGTAGYDFGFLRLEGELSYKQADITRVTEQTFGVRYVNVDGYIGALAVMMNGFLDLHNESPVTPYIGGGIGGTSLRVSNTKGVDANSGAANNHVFEDDEATVFAYQLGAGLEVVFNPHLSLDLGYRYFGTSRGHFVKNWPSSTDLKFESHNAAIGLRVKF